MRSSNAIVAAPPTRLSHDHTGSAKVCLSKPRREVEGKIPGCSGGELSEQEMNLNLTWLRRWRRRGRTKSTRLVDVQRQCRDGVVQRRNTTPTRKRLRRLTLPRPPRLRPRRSARSWVEITQFHGAFVLNHRVVLHAIDATPARWRGDAGSPPLDGARTAASSPRIDLCTRHTG